MLVVVLGLNGVGLQHTVAAHHVMRLLLWTLTGTYLSWVVCIAGGPVLDLRHHYYSIAPANYTSAKASCEAQGMVLASAHTPTLARALNNWVVQLQSGNISQYWVGAQYNATGGNWAWVNGAKWTYTRLPTAQPANNEHCLTVIAGRNDGEWDDQSCGVDRPYVCAVSKLLHNARYPSASSYGRDCRKAYLIVIGLSPPNTCSSIDAGLLHLAQRIAVTKGYYNHNSHVLYYSTPCCYCLIAIL